MWLGISCKNYDSPFSCCSKKACLTLSCHCCLNFYYLPCKELTFSKESACLFLEIKIFWDYSLYQVWLKLPYVLEKIFNSSMYFHFSPLLSPYKSLNLNKFESLVQNNVWRQVRLELNQLFLRRKYLNVVNVFSQCHWNLVCEKCMILYLNKLEFPLLKNSFAKFGWNWPCGSGEKDFQELLNEKSKLCKYTKCSLLIINLHKQQTYAFV